MYGKRLKYLLGLVVMTLGLAGCGAMQNHNTDYSGPKDALFEDALMHQRWIQDEYAEYQSRRGYKAFAIAVDHPPLIIATGFADDKVSKQVGWSNKRTGDRRKIEPCNSVSLTAMTQTPAARCWIVNNAISGCAG